MQLTRRQLLRVAGAGAATLALSPLRLLADDKTGFKLPPLPYPVDALEPHLDAKTMEIHHGRHHKAYVDNLNNVILKDSPFLQQTLKDDKGIVEVLRAIDKVEEKVRQAVINNGGGHANHTMFWQIMGKSGGGQPKAELAKAIDGTFGSFDKFKAAIKDAGMKRFGSGWSWLVLDKGKLEVISTGNQDSPYMKGQKPILGVDVWEHAYYLKYQNQRAAYIDAWWNVVNWDVVTDRYVKALKG